MTDEITQRPTSEIVSPQVSLTWCALSEMSPQTLHEVMAFRQRVFVIEQRCFYLDADAKDLEALHLLGRDSDGSLIGYLRAYPDPTTNEMGSCLRWRVGRVAINLAHRRHGLGAQLMRSCHQELARRGAKAVMLAAQTQVKGFYQRLGYVSRGAEFIDAGIPHVMMERAITQVSATPRDASVGELKHLVFDFDGTLVDSAYDYARCFQELAGGWGRARPIPSADRIRDLMFAGIRPQLEYTLGELDDAEYLQALEAFRVICHRVPMVHTSPYPGVTRALSTLHARGYTLSVCTNRPEDLAEEALKALGLRDWFSAVVGGDRGLERKPSPEMLTHLWSEVGLGPSESVLVGDSDVDVFAARAAGCRAVSVTWGYSPRAHLETLGADVILEQSARLSHLPELLG